MATEKRLIDANALITVFEKEVEQSTYSYFHLDEIVDEIISSATVDAVEVVYGEWSTIEDDYIGMTALKCSKCNEEWWFEDEPPMRIYKYCPNCGAKMDGDGNGT